MAAAPAAALLPFPLCNSAMASAFALLLAAAAALTFVPGVTSEPTQDKQALLDFFSQTHHAFRLRWNASASACTWVGVDCDPSRSFVYSLRLPGVGLAGPIPPATLGRLTRLRILSLRSNRLSGDLPPDLSNLTRLRNLYFQGNAFSGAFPPALTQLTRLVRLDLSSNNFSGPIPFAVNNLTRLTGLFLENNGFSGALPSINTGGGLDAFNVSNNSLNGSIPASLTKFPVSSFVGNLQLCGGPLLPCSRSFFPSPAPSPSIVQNPPIPVQKNNPKKLRTGLIIAIAVGAAVVVLLLLMFLIVWLRRRTGEQPAVAQPKPRGGVALGGTQESVTSSSKEDIRGGSSGSTEVTNRLVFMESGGEGVFDLEELLRASAEVLGKGTVGTSYKAMLEAGRTVVVKRLKDVAVGKEEFEAQMEAVAKRDDDNDNVAPIRAFYYSLDEKLLVFDYFPAGSLSAHLHGNRSSGRGAPLDWDGRLGIAIGAARGLAHLHHSRGLVHGNIKSSNVLIGPDHTAKVSEYGLNPLFSSASASTRVAGYKAPEVVDNRKVTFKSDVYSFGVLLLELLTGKSPDQASLGDEGIDLPRWVQSVVREEWTAEVFDVELMRSQSHSMNEEEMMVRLLQIAMSCVALLPDQRPNMAEVVRMMEDMNQNQGETTDDGGLRQSSDDPSKGSEGQTPTTTESRTPPVEGREGITP